MKRRDFLIALSSCLITGVTAPELLAKRLNNLVGHHVGSTDSFIKDYLQKMQNFDHPFTTDVVLDRQELSLLETTVARLKRVQRTVGYGNFHLLSIDDAIKMARAYTRIGPFSKKELIFMEKIFFHDAADYGFVDEKPLTGFTDKIDINRATKVDRTGHFLYKGESLNTYRRIRKDLGPNVILTSGIRSIVKQFLLFLSKAQRNKGNLSLASRSLAPPGYSFHSVGDFDVGQVNFGVANFTARFTTTQVYHNLISLGYAQLRYTQNNLLGVRFEPWHIKLPGSMVSS